MTIQSTPFIADTLGAWEHELVSLIARESVIAGIYFSKTSVIYFWHLNLAAVHVIRMSVIVRCPQGKS